jgi:hypothetical protein
MRTAVAVLAGALAACAPAPQPPPEAQQAKPAPDLTVEPWYKQSTDELAAFNRQASELLEAGRIDDASAIVSKTQPLADRLLSASHPTLAAMQAASDHDDLYGRMLLHNQRYGWARMTYQKILVRWRTWQPQTEDTAARIKAAAEAVAECDKHL